MARGSGSYDVPVELALLGAAAVILIVAAAWSSRWLGIATPLILVAVGGALSYLPGAPEIPLEPEWILVLVLPPLLYSAAVNVPLIDFRRNLTPIADRRSRHPRRHRQCARHRRGAVLAHP